MIYVHPVGGIGNMFFHIASIWSLAKDNNDELCLLNIDKKIENLINDDRCNRKHSIEYKYLFNRFLNKNAEINDVMEYPFKFVPLEYKKDHEYVGYFQCEDYFKHRRKDIIQLFEPTEKIKSEVNKYSHLFNNICLHVRRGDYVKLYSELHLPQTMDYYDEALSYLPKNMKVLIFSDDIEWCKKNFIGDRFIFIDEVDYISIYIMSKMKHFIIANSSFSWWGAWLSDQDDKIVISPKKWFGGSLLNQDIEMKIIPNNWIKK